MKQLILICFMLSFHLAKAQYTRDSIMDIEIYTPQLVLKTNPLMYIQGTIPFTGELNLIGELTFRPNHSVEIGASYVYNGAFLNLITDSLNNSGNPQNLRFQGFRVQAAYRFYLNREKGNSNHAAPYGWFLSPRYSYSFATVNENVPSTYNSSVEITQIFLDLRLGKTLVLGNRATFEFFTGMGHKENTWREFSTQLPPGGEVVDLSDLGWYDSNFRFTLGFHFGYMIGL